MHRSSILRAASGLDYASFFTATAARRQPSAIRALQPLVSLPGMVSLGGGMPNPTLFPFKAMSLTFPDGATVAVSPADLELGLQYSPTPGLPELIERISRLQRIEHAPQVPYSIAVTPGSQDGLSKLFDALVGRDDTLLIEAPTYSGSLAYLDALGCRFAEAPTDAGGLVPDAMASMLDTWNEATQGRKPRVAYIIATGSNPSGCSLSEERKRAIYAIAQKHNMLIIEDDPYYFLQYSTKRTPSFLSMDTDGRVIRCDSFSKVLSAGIRIGIVTGPDAIVNRLNLHNQASILHTSGISQLFTLLLFRHWKVGDAGGADLAGFEEHVGVIRKFYSERCDVFMAAADRHLRANADGTGAPLASYTRPSAGMFVWMKLHGIDDTMALITREAVEKKVLLVPGAAFFPGARRTPYVRAAFSTATPEQMDMAMQRLGELLREKLAAGGASTSASTAAASAAAGVAT